MFIAQIFLEPVEKISLPPAIFVVDAVFVLQIVEENGELSDAEAVNRVEFLNEQIKIAGVAVVQIQPRRNGENKSDAIFVSGGDEFFQLSDFLGRIWLAPLFAVVRVVLRRVDVRVEIIPAAEFHQIRAIVESPGRAVKSLNHAAQRYRRRKSRPRK